MNTVYQGKTSPALLTWTAADVHSFYEIIYVFFVFYSNKSIKMNIIGKYYIKNTNFTF